MRPQTLADATQTAATLPARLGTPLLDSARDAFMQGFHLAAVVSAAIAFLLALLAATALRRAGHASELPEDAGPPEPRRSQPHLVARAEPCGEK
jgi:DHA2 family multidrug resistance protein-like MFS transporter